MKLLRKYDLSTTQLIALSFAGVITLGALVLTLPLCARSGEHTPFLDALFTATSATCVTGLIVFDTYTHWTPFGQAVILLLIQIGGLGFMTVISLVMVALKKRIGLHERKLLMQSAGSLRIGGVVRLIKRIALFTFTAEAGGALLLALRFCPQYGFGNGLWMAVFHSVSAFCNAGFDIMGRLAPFCSLTAYVGDPLVSLTISALIVGGGLGFIVWEDVLSCRLEFSKYRLHTKLVLVTTGALLLLSTAAFLLFERDHAFAGLSGGERLLAAVFQAVTPRTAGFNTIDLTALSESGGLLTTVLMLIGGSPGSTAGGVKTTTFIVLLMGALTSARGGESIEIFKRRLDSACVRQANAVFTIYTALALLSTMLLCLWEPVSLLEALFEVASAVGTVGLTMNLTPSLGSAAHMLLIFLMYAGRIGGLSLALSLAERREPVPLERPSEKILIG